MKIFIIGITGGVGSRLARSLQDCGDLVTGMVRRSEQQEKLREAGIETGIGDLTSITPEKLAELIGDVDAIVFTAGAGGGGADRTTVIDGGGVVKAIDAARIKGVDRFGLVSAFPEAWRDRNLGAGFDHYIAVKKDADKALAESGLDWIILRPSVLVDDPGRGTVALGPAQIHGQVSRQDVADTLGALLHEPGITQQILELNEGSTPISEAVESNLRR